MKSIDINNDDRRAKAIAAIQERCDVLNLSYEYTADTFIITLPKAEAAVMPSNNAALRTRKKFNTDDWGPRGVDETLPENFQMPDMGSELKEGETPGGDDEA